MRENSRGPEEGGGHPRADVAHEGPFVRFLIHALRVVLAIHLLPVVAIVAICYAIAIVFGWLAKLATAALNLFHYGPGFRTIAEGRTTPSSMPGVDAADHEPFRTDRASRFQNQDVG